MQTIPAGQFKARCLAILDEVADTHQVVVVTKRGRPVAKLVPVDDAPAPTLGSVTLVAEEDAAYFSAGEGWDAER